jgi:ADA HAT complex component 1
MGNILGTTSSETNTDAQTRMLQKLHDIPLEQLRNLLTSQIDLEIQLKHKELVLLRQELSKIEAQMLLMRKFFEVPNNAKLQNEPDDFTVKYFELLNNSLTVSYNELKRRQEMLADSGYDTPSYGCNTDAKVTDGNGLFNDRIGAASSNLDAANSSSYNTPIGHGHIYRTRSTTSSLRPSVLYRTPTPTGGQYDGQVTPQQKNLGCLYRRTDGIIVKLTCPECQRSDFSSAQGFLNHSRIAHATEFTSQDAAALKCGEIIDSIKQDHQGETGLQSLLLRNLDPAKNLNISQVYFDTTSSSANSPTNTNSAKEKSRSPRFVDKPEIVEEKKPESVETSKLFLKISRSGKMNKSEYENLVADAKSPIPNCHLFDDEEDLEDISSSETKGELSSSEPRSTFKRRKSRGGINIITKTQQPVITDSGNNSTTEEVAEKGKPENEIQAQKDKLESKEPTSVMESRNPSESNESDSSLVLKTELNSEQKQKVVEPPKEVREKRKRKRTLYAV